MLINNHRKSCLSVCLSACLCLSVSVCLSLVMLSLFSALFCFLFVWMLYVPVNRCSRTQNSASSESRTSNPLIPILTLYHWATALLYYYSLFWITYSVHALFCLFCYFKSQVNSYGHGGAVSSPNHTFSWASLNKWVMTSTLCTYFRL